MNRKDIYSFLILLSGAVLLALPFLKGPYALFPFHSHSGAPWSAEASGELLNQPANHNVGDKQSIIYPDLVFSKSEFEAGHMPLWNPHNFAGLPHQAVPLAATSYPLSALAAFTSPVDALALSMVLHLFLGALFTFLFLRGQKVRAGPALLGGVAWAFSGWTMVHVHHAYFVNTMTWLPLALFALDRILDARPRWALMVLSIAIAMMLLAGFPQTAIINLYFIAAWTFVGLVRVARQEGAEVAIRRTRFLAMFAILGLLLAAIQLLPTLDYRSEVGHQNRSIADLKADSLRPVTLVHLVAPDLFGNPSFTRTPQDNLFALWLLADGRPDGHIANNYSERSFYVGLLGLLLALLTPFFRRDRAAMTLYLGALLSVFLALGTPLLNLVARFPAMNFGSPMRFTQIAGFALPCLFAMTLDRILALRSGHLSRIWKGLTITLGLLLATLGITVVTMWLAEEKTAHLLVKSLQFMGADRILGTAALSMPEQMKLIARHHDALRATLSAVLIFALGTWTCLALMFHSKRSSRVVFSLAVLVVVAELGWYGYRFNQPVVKDRLYEPTQGIRFLGNALGNARFVRFDRSTTTSFFLPNTGLIYGLNDAQGYRAMTPTTFLDFMRTLEDNPFDVGYMNLDQPGSLTSPQLDLLRVRYVTSRDPIQDAPLPRVYPPAGSTGRADMYIYHNDNILPRAFVVHDVRVMPVADMAQEFTTLAHEKNAAQDNPFAETVWLEELPRGMRSHYPRPDGPESTLIAEERAGRIAIDLNVTVPGILVLSEQFSPGWKVRVTTKGRKRPVTRPILRANMTFMAVPVSEGDSRLEFVYQPDSFKWGGLISGLALIFLLLVPLIGPLSTPRVVLTRIEADGSESWTGVEEEAP